jgi:hypothetical protein
MFQEHNSCNFNSQKENMMQATNVKQVAKPELINEVYNPALSKKADKANALKSNVVDLQKQKSCDRMSEAYSDCV